jgi:prepilin-type N-terminal cleavage/methylation domain-containing protein
MSRVRSHFSHVQPSCALDDRGFTLVEVLIAMLLVVTAVTGVMALVGVSVKAAYASRTETTATMLAEQKVEQLRGLTWGFEPANPATPLSDTTTDLSRWPPTGGGRGLNPSPSSTLDTNTDGYVDYLDARGTWVGTGTTPPPNAVYIRRWNVALLPAHPADTLLLQVLVTTVSRELELHGSTGPRRRFADDALVATTKTRKGQ